jgi:GxxExxY protein
MLGKSMTENEIAKEIVDAAYKIHTRLGPGLLESAYQVVLAHDLRKRNLHLIEEAPISLRYDDLLWRRLFAQT